MGPADPAKPVVNSISTPSFAAGVPEVTAVGYVSGRLTVSLEFDPEKLVLAEFATVRGFRVLDEGDLLEFWNAETRVEGWLWSVEEGGWFAQEKLRNGFLSGAGDRTFLEYLILGQNDCVSVFSDDSPKVLLRDGEQ